MKQALIPLLLGAFLLTACGGSGGGDIVAGRAGRRR